MLSNEFSLSEYTKIDVGWGFAPCTPHCGSLQRSRGPLRGRRGMEPGGGEGRTKGGGRGEGTQRGNGRDGKMGKLGGIAPSLLVVG